MQNQQCFVLSYIKYGDQDAVLHCFSRESGFGSYFARGIYAPKNRKKPYLMPLNLLNIAVNSGDKSGKIPNLSKLESGENNPENGSLIQNSILFFIAEFLNQMLREERENETIFKEILRFRTETLHGNPNAHISFLLRFLQISGVAPLINEKTFLQPETGTFVDEKFHNLFNEELSEIWKQLLTASNSYEIKLKRNARNLFTDSLMSYYQIHFSGFRIPKSLEILRQIYG